MNQKDEGERPSFLDDDSLHPLEKKLCAEVLINGSTDLAMLVQLLNKSDEPSPALYRRYAKLARAVAAEFSDTAQRAAREADRRDAEARVATAAALRKAAAQKGA